MKKTTLALLAAFAGTTVFASTVFIDFSMFGTQTAAPYNNIQLAFGGTSGSVADLIDTDSNATGWSFDFSSTGVSLNGGTGIPAPTEDPTLFDANAYSDFIRSHDGAGVWTQTLSGLNPALTYDIVVWARNTTNVVTASADYAFTAGTPGSTTTLTGLNLRTGTLSTFSDVAPSAGGVIQWTVSSNDNRGLALNAIQITAIPEPGTLALVGIAIGSLLLFRRRK